MPPMATRSATKDGEVTDANFTHYEACIKGGHIGLAVTKHAYVSEQGRALLQNPDWSEEEFS